MTLDAVEEDGAGFSLRAPQGLSLRRPPAFVYWQRASCQLIDSIRSQYTTPGSGLA